jgi:F-type H+-transporting ATPase subunit b
MIHNPVTQFASDSASSGIGALGVDVKALVIQLVTFVLVFLVLKRFAFKPILKVLKERRDLIEQGVALGEQMKQDQAALEAKIAAELVKARQEADGIIASAQETSRQTIREAEDKAHTKADGIIKEGEQRVASEMTRARKKLEGELVGLISDATEAIIGEKVDASKDAALIDRALKEQRA